MPAPSLSFRREIRARARHADFLAAQVLEGKKVRVARRTGPLRSTLVVKSLEGADILWVEEAQNVSKKSWRTVIPAIRKPGSEIWVTFNSELETDDTYQRFVVSPPPGAVVVKTSFRDNPALSEKLRAEQCFFLGVIGNAKSRVGSWHRSPFLACPGWRRCARDLRQKASKNNLRYKRDLFDGAMRFTSA